MEYFNLEKLLTLQVIYWQFVTPIKTGPKNLEYFFLCPYPVTINIRNLVLSYSKVSLFTRHPKITIWDILKKTPTITVSRKPNKEQDIGKS